MLASIRVIYGEFLPAEIVVICGGMVMLFGVRVIASMVMFASMGVIYRVVLMLYGMVYLCGFRKMIVMLMYVQSSASCSSSMVCGCSGFRYRNASGSNTIWRYSSASGYMRILSIIMRG
jgi:hypothetical protein